MNNKNHLDTQARKALWLSIGMSVTLIIALSFPIKNAITTISTGDVTWVEVVGLFSMTFVISTASISIYLSRKGRHIFGMQLLISGLLLIALLSTLTLKGQSPIISIITVTLIIFIATQTLPDLIATRAISMSILVGIINVLLDLWLPLERSTIFDFRTINIVGAVATILGVVIASQYRTFRLRTKLLIMFIAVPAVIIVIISGAFLLNIANDVKEQVIINNRTDLDIKISGINAFLDTSGADVHFLSSSAALNDYLTHLDDNANVNAIAEARTSLNQEFYAFAQARLIYDQIRFIDVMGQEIVRINTSGDGVSTIVVEEDLQNKSGRYYFEDTFSQPEGSLFISLLDLNVEDGEVESPNKPVIRYGTPVFFNGERVGVIVMNVLADNFLNALENSEINSFLVNKDGYFLYHPDEDLRWGQDLGTDINVAQEIPDLASPLFSIGGGSYESSSQLYSYAPVIIPGETTPRWFLANFISIDEAFAPTANAIAPVLTVVAIALMLTPLAAIFVSQSIAAPVLSLTDIAQKVADGDLSIKAPVTTQDEIGLLAATFNTMTTRLQNLIGSLEERVVERTRDLALAAEVGGTVAQIRDLDKLLANAVGLIQSRFNLYYTQVYLVDENNQKLQLRAGTGEVGKELVGRGFSLPLGPGSINGMAVFNKKPIIVANTNKSVVFRPNALLPETRSEMVIPLIVGDLVVGVLDLQSDQINALSDETLPAFEALASQLTIAIENANLFAEVARTRAEVESQARRLIRDGWDNSLDGLHESEHIGFCYEEGGIHSLAKPLESMKENGRFLSASISVVGEPIGAIQIEGDPDQAWRPEELELVNIIAQQVGQQVENLRLLDDAQRYREEAENASRRLIRDGWSNFQEESNIDGYLYNQKDVLSLQKADNTMNENELFMQPLTVQGEIIGMLEVDGVDRGDEEASVLLTAVADQLSSHIDNLRLTEQTETALAESQRQSEELTLINRIVSDVASSLNIQQSMQVVVEELAEALQIEQIRIALLNNDRTELRVIAEHFDPTKTASAMDFSIPLINNVVTNEVLDTRRLAVIKNVQHNPKTAYMHDLFREQGVETLIILPMIAGNQVIGTVGIDILNKDRTLNDTQLNLAETIIYQAATAVQNARLFQETEERARELDLINRTAQAVSQQLEPRKLLETIYEQVVQIMSVDAFVVATYDPDKHTINNLLVYDDDLRYPEVTSTPSLSNKTYQIVQTGEPILLNRTADQVAERMGEVSQLPDTRLGGGNKVSASLLYVPLTVGDNTVGSISVQSYQYNAYDQDDVDLLTGVANHVAVAMVNAQLFTQAEERAEEMGVINQVAQVVAQQLESKQLFLAVHEQLQRAILNDTFYVATYDAEQELFHFPFMFDGGELREASPMAAKPNLELTKVVKSGEPIIWNRTLEEMQELKDLKLLLGDKSPTSMVFVPLRLGEQIIGVISVQNYEYHAYSQSETDLLAGVANHMAVALENIRLFNEAKRRAERESMINAISQKIQAAPTIQGAMQTAVSELGQALKLKKAIAELTVDNKENGHVQPSQIELAGELTHE